jgi:hypothetical protein
MGLSNYLPSSRLIKPGVCTSTTRPASPFEGQVIYETDTDKMLVYNGSAWYAPWNTAWGIVAQVVDSSSTNVSITSTFTTMLSAPSFTAVANRRYLITASWTFYAGSNAQVVDFDIANGATVLNRSYWYAAISGTQMSGAMQAYTTLSAGSTTITLQAKHEGGSNATLWNNGITRNNLVVTDVGPA